MPAPLEGIKILDFTRFQAGPTGTVVLSDLGAEIIKVEMPGRGDEGRYIFPLSDNGATPYFIAHDRGKKGITVDYHRSEGCEILLRLGAGCDAVVENFRPGAADGLGLGYEDFVRHNERIVYASVSAYGDEGPLAEEPGFDIHGQAAGGIMSVAGTDDGSYSAGAAIGDQLAGMTLASAVMGGLLARELHGLGQKVSVSLYGCQISLQAWEINQYSLGGQLPDKAGTSHPLLRKSGMIWGSYPTKEGDIVLGGLGGKRWERFCALLGIEDETEVDPQQSFLLDRSGWDQEIRERLKTRTADEWVAAFREEDLMISKVNTYADILADPQAWANGYLVEMEDPTRKNVKVVGSPYHFSRTPVQNQGPPPELGQHTELVLLEFGFSWEEIGRFRESGVI